jgi:beta-lactamase superfamily II metal-dependent hydrolase
VTCQLTFLPVGNADSIVVQTDDSTIIVDLGKLSILEDWLQEREISKIDRIYITHAHGDHFPSLIKLVDFINTWRNHIDIKKVHFPTKALEVAWRKVRSDRENNRKLEHTLVRIADWSRRREVIHSPIFRDGEDYSEGLLKVEALHPSEEFVGNHLASTASKLNEISTVLQISYGSFSAMLLADIEGAGLAELLSFLKATSESAKFIANVAKIPHHGAYPVNGNDLKELLSLINAEIAVLSVGSKNTYGHVAPELFKLLIELQNNNDQRLGRFICTEVTRTCIYSASDRAKMEKTRGLSTPKKCAGQITIIADISGQWTLKTETTDHHREVANFVCAACDGRADLG